MGGVLEWAWNRKSVREKRNKQSGRKSGIEFALIWTTLYILYLFLNYDVFISKTNRITCKNLYIWKNSFLCYPTMSQNLHVSLEFERTLNA